MSDRKDIEWTQEKELPIEINLTPNPCLHSIFICPVLRVSTTKSNPAEMLPCGHVLSKEAISRISKGNAFT